MMQASSLHQDSTQMFQGRVFRAALIRLRGFLRNRDANVAMIFALAMVPTVIAAGAGLDLARSMIVKSALTEALDASALAAASTPGATQAQMQTAAQNYFNANYKVDSAFGAPVALSVVQGTQSVTVSTSVPMPTTLMNVAGIKTVNVTASSTVVWGQTKLWVSLVLDNTGSMCQSDSNPNASSPCAHPASTTKIASLQTATHSLLTLLQNAAINDGDVKVAIVPFVKDVNVDKSLYGSASWIDWTDWNAANGSCNTDGDTQAACVVAHCSSTRYTTKSNCQNNRSTWYNAGTWTAANHSTWTGCVEDRGSDSGPDATNNYDAMNTSPSTSTNSKFPAEQYDSCPVPIMGLTSNWTNLSAKVDAMAAVGATNQPIGLVWGWHALSVGTPLSAGSLPANTARYIIILSDGLNTQDRWYGDGVNQSTSVDNRMTAVCTNAKADKIVVYAVFVDIGGTQGNSAALSACASDPSKYFDLTSTSQIASTFAAIGAQITNLRVSQ
jgi:Flp pilus assembly protein TadG